MRTVPLHLSTTGEITPDNILIGYEGEHNVTSLEISMSSAIADSISFFRLVLGDYLSEDLYPTDNKIIYPLPQSVMFSNTLLIQLEGYVNNDVGEIEVVFKSDLVTAIIKPSICAYHEVPKELEEDINGAFAKLSYYVQNSSELSSNISDMLEETKDFVVNTSESFEARAESANQTLTDKVREGYSVLLQTQETLSNKADRMNTLEGYGIKDAYTKSETDIMLLEKANLNGVYAKDEIDNALSCGMVEEYKSETAMFKTYYHSDDLTLEVTQYLYIEHPEPLMPNAKYKLKFDCFYDLTEVNNFCVCVGDIHHPVIQNIPPTNGDFETYTFIEYAEFSLPETVSATDKIFFRFDMVRDPIARYVPYTLFASRLLPCYSKSEVDGLLESKADSSDIPTKVSDLENDNGYLVASDIENKADSSDIPTKVSDLENDNGYLVASDIESKADSSAVPTKVSDLENDSGYITAEAIENKADSSAVPTKVSELENDSGYITAEAIENKADKPQTIIYNNNTVFLTLRDNVHYRFTEPLINLFVEGYPSGDFICSLEFTVSPDEGITVTLPSSKYIGGAPAFAEGETWELNIRNGVVVGGLVE